MSKFIVIDPSIQGFGGHYYEYACRVVQAAAEQGYAPIIAAHRCCQVPPLDSIEIHPVYRDTFWSRFAGSERASFLNGIAGAVKRQLFLAKVRLRFSRIGLWWAIRDRFKEDLQRGSLTKTSMTVMLGLLAFLYVFRIFRAILRIGWHAIPFRDGLLGYFSLLGTDCQALVQVAVRPWTRLLDPTRGLRHRILARSKTRRFCEDTVQLFREVPLAPGDVVFMTMASALELQVLARYFQQDIRSRNATWHMLFRHQLFTAAEGGPYSEAMRPLRIACQQLQQACKGQRVFFYTDTEDLTAQYNSLQLFPFQTLPIPVGKEYRAVPVPRKAQRPLQIAYVGDARQEKGFPHLPRIVEDLWQDYVENGKVVFAIQSHFNVPEGTPATVIARAQLEALPTDRVRLIDQPLSPSDYCKLVTSSDIILLPYDTRPYYAGSSGILVEALAAGIPVIVPTGIWMSRQFARETRRHHERLAARLDKVGTLAAPDVQWRLPPDIPVELPADLSLSMGGGARKPYTKLDVPANAEFLLLSIGADSRDSAAPLLVWVDQHNGECSSVRGKNYNLSPATGFEQSLFIPLATGAQVIYVQIWKTTPKSPEEVYDVRFDFLARRTPGEPCPTGAVGLAYSDPYEITGLVREMVDNYAHYQTTARAFSQNWFAKHQASALVAQIRHGVQPAAGMRRAA